MDGNLGHRDRVRARFLKNGIEGLADYEMLELLLFFAIPRRDTKPIAKALLAEFGTLDAVLDAPIEHLKKIDGIGANAALLIKLIVPLGREYMIARGRSDTIINSTEKAGNYLKHFFHAEHDEVVYMICLDSKFKIIDSKMMFRGSVNSANINVRKIVEHALAQHSVSVILAHNHISGVTQPSREDIEATRRVSEALKTVDIVLADHIIITGDNFVSMADLGNI